MVPRPCRRRISRVIGNKEYTLSRAVCSSPVSTGNGCVEILVNISIYNSQAASWSAWSTMNSSSSNLVFSLTFCNWNLLSHVPRFIHQLPQSPPATPQFLDPAPRCQPESPPVAGNARGCRSSGCEANLVASPDADETGDVSLSPRHLAWTTSALRPPTPTLCATRYTAPHWTEAHHGGAISSHRQRYAR